MTDDVLIDMQNIHIEGFSDEEWHPIIKGVNLTLKRGQVMGLIGESGAGKSTLGLAALPKRPLKKNVNFGVIE